MNILFFEPNVSYVTLIWITGKLVKIIVSLEYQVLEYQSKAEQIRHIKEESWPAKANFPTRQYSRTHSESHGTPGGCMSKSKRIATSNVAVPIYNSVAQVAQALFIFFLWGAGKKGTYRWPVTITPSNADEARQPGRTGPFSVGDYGEGGGEWI